MTQTAQSLDAQERPIRRVLRGHHGQIAGISLTSALAALAEAAFLVLVTTTALSLTSDDEQVVVAGDLTLSQTAALLLAIVFIVLRVGFGLANSWLSGSVISAVGARLRKELTDAYLRATWAEHHGERQGQLQEMLTTFANRAAEVVAGVTAAITASFSLITLLIVAVVVDPLASGIVIVSVALLSLVLRPLRSVVRRWAARSADVGMEYATALSETSAISMEVHVFDIRDEVERRLDEVVDRGARIAQRHQFVRGALPISYTGIAYVAVAGALVAIGQIESADIAAVSSVMLLMLRSLSYGQALQTSSATITSALPFIERFNRDIDRYRDAGEVDLERPITALGRISLESVTFEYVPGTPVLGNIDLTIEQREIVGVVGPSGSGKSTLVQLLLGLREPVTGVVTADGRDIREFSKREWARTVTFVPQEAHLISGTIADNIRFLREDVTQEMVEEASRLANLHDDVAGFAEGYDRQVGEQGSHLSGGQQQRLIIARALVENPDLLVLDEPTSSLDVRSEHLIRQTLNTLREKMTVVIIAHRLSTLEICDRIMVIQDGELKGFDTPENLEKTNDFYREALILSGMR
jgi:ABC-type multidrug transport system fused ATPase/permease subunit